MRACALRLDSLFLFRQRDGVISTFVKLLQVCSRGICAIHTLVQFISGNADIRAGARIFYTRGASANLRVFVFRGVLTCKGNLLIVFSYI